jgi:hypothetical protein
LTPVPVDSGVFGLELVGNSPWKQFTDAIDSMHQRCEQ